MLVFLHLSPQDYLILTVAIIFEFLQQLPQGFAFLGKILSCLFMQLALYDKFGLFEIGLLVVVLEKFFFC